MRARRCRPPPRDCNASDTGCGRSLRRFARRSPDASSGTARLSAGIADRGDRVARCRLSRPKLRRSDHVDGAPHRPRVQLRQCRHAPASRARLCIEDVTALGNRARWAANNLRADRGARHSGVHRYRGDGRRRQRERSARRASGRSRRRLWHAGGRSGRHLRCICRARAFERAWRAPHEPGATDTRAGRGLGGERRRHVGLSGDCAAPRPDRSAGRLPDGCVDP